MLLPRLLRFARNDGVGARNDGVLGHDARTRHCEERSDEAI